MDATLTTGRHPAAAPPRRRPWWRRLLRGLAALTGWAAVLAAAASLGAVALGGEAGIRVILLAALSAWAGPLLLAAVVLLALGRWRRSTLAAGAVLVLAAVWMPPLPHGGGHAGVPTGQGRQLRVMTQNLLFGQADPAALVARVAAQRPDVLALTELTPAAARALDAAGLATLMPHRHLLPAPSAAGTGLYSTRPLTEPGQIPGTAFRAVRARVDVGGHPVTVAAVHPAPPQLPTWAADHAALAAAFGPGIAAGEQVVLAGDFNATTGNGPFRRLLGIGLVDAAQAGSWAWQGQSWPADRLPLPVIRIDHVLAPRGTVVDRIDTLHLPGSDHRGVIAALTLPPA